MAHGGIVAFESILSWKVCQRSYLFHLRWGIWIWVRPAFSLLMINGLHHSISIAALLKKSVRGSHAWLNAYFLSVHRSRSTQFKMDWGLFGSYMFCLFKIYLLIQIQLLPVSSFMVILPWCCGMYLSKHNMNIWFGTDHGFTQQSWTLS